MVFKGGNCEVGLMNDNEHPQKLVLMHQVSMREFQR